VDNARSEFASLVPVRTVWLTSRAFLGAVLVKLDVGCDGRPAWLLYSQILPLCTSSQFVPRSL